ncbi:hypothetical protein K2F45_12360 [Sphingobacterium siyangense]|uniref:hypothetical protein n=1 Tax=Sphingobacterium TaxID=28453 RepID=UPI0009585C06|nr:MULTISPECIES: hypothetical protein [Sphingobacterium]APU97305.1 hypothetical protein BV902_13915 [Sphingobacterium sp. B29]UQA77723.1 hypothetical protein K2F45_12360 [Sphingobacterium siyangense]
MAGNDVYVSGVSIDPNSNEPMAVYWKNGQMVILAKGETFTQALAIAVAGNDVYVAALFIGEGTKRSYFEGLV